MKVCSKKNDKISIKIVFKFFFLEKSNLSLIGLFNLLDFGYPFRFGLQLWKIYYKYMNWTQL